VPAAAAVLPTSPVAFYEATMAWKSGGSLIRVANLHANILRIGQPERMAELFAMIS
jgi:hypothetical protein